MKSNTSGTLIAEMLMTRSGGYHGVFLIVEGPDDSRFWQPRVRIKHEAIIVANGIHNLQGCMKSLDNRLLGSVCAIADTDFCNFMPEDKFSECADVYFYDEGFLETFILNTAALRKVISVHADPVRVEAFQRNNKPHTIYSHLRLIASKFGRLRILNERNSWGACFDKIFTPHKYVKIETWELNEHQLMTDYATKVGHPVSEIQSACASISIPGSMQLVHGHDSLKILSIGLQCVLGSSNIGHKALFKDLILAFETESLKNKKLISKLRNWAKTRPLLI